MTRFENPWVLLLLLLLPLLYLAYRRVVYTRRVRLRFSNIHLFRDAKPSFRHRLHALPLILRFVALALVIIAIARPQSGVSSTTVESEGIDIILVIDTSGSMQAVDMTPETRGASSTRDVSRIDVSKQAAHEFIDGRTSDRIGLVVFAGQALTQCPPTMDYQVLKGFLTKVDVGQLDDGTAIGTALATATNRLRESTSKSRVIILLTDGDNNAGMIDPITAAKAAHALGVKIYTIGAGREENPRFPIDGFFGKQYIRQSSPIDEETLKKIAAIGEGQYFRATSPEGLSRIYEEIGELEKTKIETREYVDYTELAQGLVVPAFLLLLLESLLAQTLLRRLP